MFDPASVRVQGPVQAYARGFWAELERQGFRSLTILRHLQLLAHLGRWLGAKKLRVQDLTDERAREFILHRLRVGYTGLRTVRSIEPFLRFARGLGVAPAPARVPDGSPVDRFVAEYASYLVRERGLAATTIHIYAYHVRRFIEEERPRLDWRRLAGSEVAHFLLRSSRRKGMPTCLQTVSALRSFLRFLHVRGEVEAHLASSVPCSSARTAADGCGCWPA